MIKPRPQRRGAVLILVLIVFSSLSLLAFGMVHRFRLEWKMARMRGDELRAYYLAVGGINRALAALRRPADPGDGGVVHYGQAWHLDTTAAAEGFFQSMGESWQASCTLAYAVSDEQGRLNLNRTSPAGWVKLPGVTRPMVNGILDWTDEDDSPQMEGAESDYYLRQAYPYRAKNAPIGMVRELSLIAHVGWQTANGIAVDASVDSGGTASAAFTGYGAGGPGFGLADFFTVYGDGTVNLNTASPTVLAALLHDTSLQAAPALIAYRNGRDGQPFTADDRFFKSFDDLKEVNDLTELTRDSLQQYGSFTSGYFRICSQASVRQGGPVTRLIATVRRTQEGARVILTTRQ